METQNEDLPTHKYDYKKDIEEWEKTHGEHVTHTNPPKAPKWLKKQK